MRNFLAHVSHREKKRFASKLKLIWQSPTKKDAKVLADELIEIYGKRFPQAIKILEARLEESLSYYAFPALDKRKVSSNNFMERLNREIRRRTKVIGIFPNPESYLRLVTIYLLEYTEEWITGRAYLSVKSLQTLEQKAA